MSTVTKVWIDEGCITCDACENIVPEVFSVQEDTCVIVDGVNPSEWVTTSSKPLLALLMSFCTKSLEGEEPAEEAPAEVDEAPAVQAAPPVAVEPGDGELGWFDERRSRFAHSVRKPIRKGIVCIDCQEGRRLRLSGSRSRHGWI